MRTKQGHDKRPDSYEPGLLSLIYLLLILFQSGCHPVPDQPTSETPEAWVSLFLQVVDSLTRRFCNLPLPKVCCAVS